MTEFEVVKNAQRLSHIIEAIERVERSVAGITQAEFYLNEDKQGNVIRCIEIIGEAANHISDEIRRDNDGIPWPSIIGMRNNLIHGYCEVNYEFVWETVQRDLPQLKESVKNILNSLKLPEDLNDIINKQHKKELKR